MQRDGQDRGRREEIDKRLIMKIKGPESQEIKQGPVNTLIGPFVVFRAGVTR